MNIIRNKIPTIIGSGTNIPSCLKLNRCYVRFAKNTALKNYHWKISGAELPRRTQSAKCAAGITTYHNLKIPISSAEQMYYRLTNTKHSIRKNLPKIPIIITLTKRQIIINRRLTFVLYAENMNSVIFHQMKFVRFADGKMINLWKMSRIVGQGVLMIYVSMILLKDINY